MADQSVPRVGRHLVAARLLGRNLHPVGLHNGPQMLGEPDAEPLRGVGRGCMSGPAPTDGLLGLGGLENVLGDALGYFGGELFWTRFAAGTCRSGCGLRRWFRNRNFGPLPWCGSCACSGGRFDRFGDLVDARRDGAGHHDTPLLQLRPHGPDQVLPEMGGGVGRGMVGPASLDDFLRIPGLESAHRQLADQFVSDIVGADTLGCGGRSGFGGGSCGPRWRR